MPNIFKDLKEFAMRGNVVDLAVGFTVGAAFTTIARSLVDDIIMPIVGLIVGEVEFRDLFWLLKAGPNQPPPYTTLADAQAAGAVTVNYGIFINNVLAFPGVFRGAFDVRASRINREMKLAAAYALAGLISPEELSAERIIPEAFDPRVGKAVAKAVALAARASGVARK